MNRKNLRVIVLTQGAGDRAVRRLAALDCIELAGIFVETKVARLGSLKKLRRSLRYDDYGVIVSKLIHKLPGLGNGSSRAAQISDSLQNTMRRTAEELGIPVQFVNDFHSDEAISFMRAAEPDLAVVLGTNILKEKVFRIPRLGSINMHQGLAPYYRGGPPVFWELHNDEPELGLTVHFVEAKVDSGDILVQRAVPLEYDYSYGLNYQAFIDDYREKLDGVCASLIAEAVAALSEGTAIRRRQDTALGKRYRLPTRQEKRELRRRLRERRRAQTGYVLARKASTRSL